MKVLLSPHLEHFTVGLAGELAKRVDLELVTMARYPINVKQKVVPRVPLPKQRDLLLKLALRLTAKNYDVVHANLAIYGEAALSGNVLVTEHGWPDPDLVERGKKLFYYKERKSLMRLYEVGVPIVTVGNFSARMLREKLGIKVRAVVHNGVLDAFRNDSPRRAPRKHVILWVSRLVSFKEPFVLLEAVKYLKGKADFRVVIRGEGPLMRRVLKYLTDHDLRGVVNVVERVGFHKLPSLYRLATVFAHTCSKEAFSLAILEAMASGLPLVVPDAGGAAEAVGETCLKFQPGDSKELADRLLALIHDEQLYETLSRKSIERARSFSWEKAAAEYVKLYERVC